MSVARFEPSSVIISTIVLTWCAGLLFGVIVVEWMDGGRLTFSPALALLFAALAFAKTHDLLRRYGVVTNSAR